MTPSTPHVRMTWRLRLLVRRSQRINVRETRLRTCHGHRVRGDIWTIGPTRPGFRKRREPFPRAPRIAEVEDALPPAVRRLCPRPGSLPKRRNKMPRSRLSSTSSWKTASASTTREVNIAPAWLPKGAAPTHTPSSMCRGEHTPESNGSRQPKRSTTSWHSRRKC